MSPEITASSGLDVLTHAAEAFTNKAYSIRPRPESPALRGAFIGANPISDLWSESAIEWAGQYLRRACYNGNDLEARIHMAMGSTFAGIGYGDAGVYIPRRWLSHCRNGQGMGPGWLWRQRADGPPRHPDGLTAPACFRFTAPTSPEKHARIAELLRAKTEGLPANDAAMLLPDVITRLLKDVGCPNGLSALGYTEADLPEIVEGGLEAAAVACGQPPPSHRNRPPLDPGGIDGSLVTSGRVYSGAPRQPETG